MNQNARRVLYRMVREHREGTCVSARIAANIREIHRPNENKQGNLRCLKCARNNKKPSTGSAY